jgi:hypothetical protein
MSRRIIALTVLILGLAATVFAVFGANVAIARPAASAVGVSCSPSGSVKLPDGSALRLSGVWKAASSGANAYVRQLGNCYWLLVLSPGGGAQFSTVALGRINPDLTIDGAWADSPRMTTYMGNGVFHSKIIIGSTGKLTISAGGPTEDPLTLNRRCQTWNHC